jgi:membrane protein implicated in regulation of membrane protease activity
VQLWAIYLIIAGLLLIAEMLSFTFYLLWLGVGALVAAAVAWIAPDQFIIQVLSGCAASLLLTIFTKPLTRRLRASKGFKDAIDELIGKQAVVVEDIHPGQYGVVKVGSESWTATAIEPIYKGEVVLVVARSSTIVEVHKMGGNM